ADGDGLRQRDVDGDQGRARESPPSPGGRSKVERTAVATGWVEQRSRQDAGTQNEQQRDAGEQLGRGDGGDDHELPAEGEDGGGASAHMAARAGQWPA